ncbi:MAG: hypothetical protein HY690_03270 [Chloroflexi bacterium]|nr:hypothetical protein [Chloroflexota bacterium]
MEVPYARTAAVAPMMAAQLDGGSARASDAVRSAVRAALVYADLFDYPLRAEEVRRFLPGCPATGSEVGAALADWPSRLGLHFLPGREHLVELRLARAQWAAATLPEARRYGRLLWSLPFVEMVGLTGSLAVRNADPGEDLDFMLVTRPGRLWTVRALTIGVVRLARLRGVCLCPNYLLASRALALRQRSLFVAHELAQLVPLHGFAAYRALLAANPWALELLPNAEPYPASAVDDCLAGARRSVRLLAERCLAAEVGNRFEAWEAGRKIARFRAEAGQDTELAFSPDECKGHFERHGRRIMATYADHLAAAGATAWGAADG